jgi:hypothetical protein
VRGREAQSRQNKRNKEIRQIKTTCGLFAFYVPLHIVVKWVTYKGSSEDRIVFIFLFILSASLILYE